MDHKWYCIIALHLAHRTVPEIVQELQHLNVNKMLVYRTIKRYQESGSVKRRYVENRHRTATNEYMLEKVNQLLDSDPTQSIRKVARTLGISDWAVRQMAKRDMLTRKRLYQEQDPDMPPRKTKKADGEVVASVSPKKEPAKKPIKKAAATKAAAAPSTEEENPVQVVIVVNGEPMIEYNKGKAAAAGAKAAAKKEPKAAAAKKEPKAAASKKKATSKQTSEESVSESPAKKARVKKDPEAPEIEVTPKKVKAAKPKKTAAAVVKDEPEPAVPKAVAPKKKEAAPKKPKGKPETDGVVAEVKPKATKQKKAAAVATAEDSVKDDSAASEKEVAATKKKRVAKRKVLEPDEETPIVVHKRSFPPKPTAKATLLKKPKAKPRSKSADEEEELIVVDGNEDDYIVVVKEEEAENHIEEVEEEDDDDVLVPVTVEVMVPKRVLKNQAATNYLDLEFSHTKDHNLKIASWNVSGLRAWINKGGKQYVTHEHPDIICLQETKCNADSIPEEAYIPGYHPYWNGSGGYAGVGIYTRKMPIAVTGGIGDEEMDADARVVTAEYEKFYLVNVYVPNSGRGLVTLPKRLRWNQLFKDYVLALDSIKPVIVAGDMNVAHLEIDLANPKTNKKNAGFTVEERADMTDLLAAGFVDTYRYLYPETTGAYTFWTYMANARAKNVGWRLDYIIVSERLVKKLVDNQIRSKVYGSDHCPIVGLFKL